VKVWTLADPTTSQDQVGVGSPRGTSPRGEVVEHAPPLWLNRVKGAPPPEPNATTIVDKSATLLSQHGRSMQIQESGGACGSRAVRGMPVKALMPLLGLDDDARHWRWLVRVVEHSGNRSSRLAARGLKVGVASEAVLSMGDAIVYLCQQDAGPGGSTSAMASQQSATVRLPAAVPAAVPLQNARALADGEPDVAVESLPKASMGQSGRAPTPNEPSLRRINVEFAKLLPGWRAKNQHDHEEKCQHGSEAARGFPKLVRMKTTSMQI